MADRSWMLNPKAIRTAKECIGIVKGELGIKLTLSHPDFMQKLHEYVELTKSTSLGEAYSRLLSMAGVTNTLKDLRNKHDSRPKPSVRDSENMKAAVGAECKPDDTIKYNGKRYARWRDGKKFVGLYRGQPHYS